MVDIHPVGVVVHRRDVVGTEKPGDVPDKLGAGFGLLLLCARATGNGRGHHQRGKDEAAGNVGILHGILRGCGALS